MERLSGLDAGVLALEAATARMHAATLAVVDPATCPDGLATPALHRRLTSLVDRTPALRRRLAEVPFGLHHPVWVDEPEVDLDRHLRRIAVAAPGGTIELCELVGHLVAVPLDRGRPLWEAWLIEGVHGGRAAVLAKVHHVARRDLSPQQLVEALLAPRAGGDDHHHASTERAAVPPPPAPEPGDAALLAHALAALVTQPLRAASTVGRTVAAALRRPSAGRTTLEPAPARLAVPRTSFNATISPRRAFAATSLPRSRVQAVARATGVAVDDVVLAVCTGALRRYLDDGRERPDGPLVALVATSTPDGGRLDRPGRLCALPTDVDDPLERLRPGRAAMAQVTPLRWSIDPEVVRSWAELATPAVTGVAARLWSRLRVADRHPPPGNVVIAVAELPAPRPSSAGIGARVLASYPVHPIVDGVGLSLGVCSHDESVDVGILACPELVPAPWILADALHAALDELSHAVRGPDHLDLLTHHEALVRTVGVTGRRVVDVGCGSGALVRWLRTQGADVVGVECGAAMLAQALEADPDHHDDYREGIGQALPLPDAHADVVVYSYSLHHVPPDEMLDALRDAHRVLRPGGTLYVAEPVAAGAGHEVVRLIDDETAKRAHAQEALDRAATVGFEQVQEWRYRSRTVVTDAEALAQRMVGVDPGRAERLRRHRHEFEARFAELATPVEGGFAFDTENRVRVLRAR